MKHADKKQDKALFEKMMDAHEKKMEKKHREHKKEIKHHAESHIKKLVAKSKKK
jgi:hypothetical protein